MTDEDQTAIEARIGLIADVLRLSDEEVNKVIDSIRRDSMEGLIAFARRDNQDLDWIGFGSVRVMVAKLAGSPR
jgi:hypothetical protein